jgi:hypothetical protein
MTPFSAIKGGVFEARFQDALTEIMDDICDPNKSIVDSRVLTIKIKVQPTGRDGAKLILDSVTTKLGKVAELPTVPIQITMEEGAAVAYEKNSEADGHVGLPFPTN